MPIGMLFWGYFYKIRNDFFVESEFCKLKLALKHYIGLYKISKAILIHTMSNGLIVIILIDLQSRNQLESLDCSSVF